MRQILDAIWNAPAAEFTWFLGVLWSQFLYIVLVLLVIRWLWRKGRAVKK
jgi:hypothetical protein